MAEQTEPKAAAKTAWAWWENLLKVYNTYRRLILIVLPAVGLALVTALLPRPLLAFLLQGVIAKRSIVLLLLGFTLLTLSLLFSAGQRLDAGLFLYFNLRHLHSSRLLDGVMWLLTQIGSGGLGIGLSIFLYWLGYRILAVEMALGILTLWLFVEFMKALTDRTRPFIALAETRIVGWRARGRSFPSGHTAQAFFLMAILSHAFQWGLGGTLAFMGVAFVVGFTRIYVGAHYPRDVIGGAILGSVWGLLAAIVDPYLASRLL